MDDILFKPRFEARFGDTLIYTMDWNKPKNEQGDPQLMISFIDPDFVGETSEHLVKETRASVIEMCKLIIVAIEKAETDEVADD